jgi:hypothetical protein
MKNYLLIFLLFILACQESDKKANSTNGHHLESKILKISVDYPKAWSIFYTPDSTSPGSLITLQSPLENEADTYQENVSVYHEDLPIKVSDSLFHRAAMSQVRIANPSLTVIDKGIQKFGNNSYHSFAFDFTKESTSYVVKGFTIMKDSTGYTFNFTGAKNNEEKYGSALAGILQSFKPL